MSQCKKCGKEILWATTSPGNKPVPLDPKALVFSVMEQDGKLIAVKPTPITGERFIVSHFATCPNANEFSGGGRNAEPPPPEKHFSEPQGSD